MLESTTLSDSKLLNHYVGLTFLSDMPFFCQTRNPADMFNLKPKGRAMEANNGIVFAMAMQNVFVVSWILSAGFSIVSVWSARRNNAFVDTTTAVVTAIWSLGFSFFVALSAFAVLTVPFAFISIISVLASGAALGTFNDCNRKVHYNAMVVYAIVMVVVMFEFLSN